MTAEPSGVDLARVALAQARAAAKTAPAKKKPRKAKTVFAERTGRDPVAFGAAITRMMTERGWEVGVGAGRILNQWPTIAPQLAGKVAAERFDEETGTLALRPVSDAYATQLRLHQVKLLALIQAADGGSAVKTIRILPVGAPSRSPAGADSQSGTAAAEPAPPAPGPVRTRETASIGYQQVLAVHREHHRTPPGNVDFAARVAKAVAEQAAALRAKRPRVEDDAEYLAQLEIQERAAQAERDAVYRAALYRARTGKVLGGQAATPQKLTGAA